MRIVLFKSLSHCWEILRAKTRAQDDVAGELQNNNKEINLDIYDVVLRERLVSDLKKLPKHIIAKLTTWINAVGHDGLSEVRKIPGYHDESLQGDRKGQGCY